MAADQWESVTDGPRKNRNFTFANGRAQRLWFIGDLRVSEGLARKVFIVEGKDEMRRIYCRSAEFLGGSWLLKGGVESKIGSGADGEEWHQDFDSREENFMETPRQMAMQAKRVKDMSLGELRELLSLEIYGSERSLTLLMRYHGLWVHCLNAFLAVYFAIPFAISPPRRSGATSMAVAVVIFLSFSVLGKWIHLIAAKGWLPAGPTIWTTFILTAGLFGLWGRHRTNL
jgi:lipopolysaccharide export LptBFGC system permease protein LptF